MHQFVAAPASACALDSVGDVGNDTRRLPRVVQDADLSVDDHQHAFAAFMNGCHGWDIQQILLRSSAGPHAPAKTSGRGDAGVGGSIDYWLPQDSKEENGCVTCEV